FDDFPMLLETWRTCLQDEFDLEQLRSLLIELETGTIVWSEVHCAQASPMSQQMAWSQINTYMYRDDTPQDGRPSNLSADLLHEIVHSPALRPSVSRVTVDRFQTKSLRLIAEYTPANGRELVEWVKERLLIPAAEWRSLLDLMATVQGRDPNDPSAANAASLARLRLPRASEALIVAREMLAPIVASLPVVPTAIGVDPYDGDMADADATQPMSAPGAEAEDTPPVDLTWLLCEWLQFYGPLTLEFISGTLGIDATRAVMALDQLVDERQLICGPLVKDGQEMVYCDARNFEILLRMERRAAQPVIEPLPCEALALFFATVQGLTISTDDRQEPVERLLGIIDQMSGHALAAPLWESEVLPARMPAYDPAWLDSLMQTSDLQWLGRPDRHLTFCFEPDLDLVIQAGQDARPAYKDDNNPSTPQSSPKPSMDQVLASAGRFDFSTLLDLTGLTPAQASEELWMGVWQGRYANDSFAAMRQGIANGFKPPQIKASSGTGLRSRRGRARSAFSRWKAAL
ncbi:MAG: hypothetical protein GY701_31365, partial [Sulfitobacter sp.]|nr:hypothetical protein [Sulfitobacter sp.]